jgi:protein N-terminal amidase
MRLCSLQFAPLVGEFQANVKRAEEILNASSTRDINLLVLPEMAFTGYNFPSFKSIEQYLEPTLNGPTTKWAKAIAQKLRCHVLVGYPEQASSGRRYNSAVLIDPSGESLCNYRKHYLFPTDETWAHSGEEKFLSTHIVGLGKVSIYAWLVPQC